MIRKLITEKESKRFSFLADVLTIWFVGIPMALLGAFVPHLPVYYIYLLIFSEEFLKMLILMQRFVTKRWMNDLTLPVEIKTCIEFE